MGARRSPVGTVRASLLEFTYLNFKSSAGAKHCQRAHNPELKRERENSGRILHPLSLGDRILNKTIFEKYS